MVYSRAREGVPVKITDSFGRPWPLDHVLGCVEPGWSKLVQKLIRDLFNAGWDGELHQVKEKFGGLRFYIGAGSDEVYDLIIKAEEESFRVCEKCGEPGKRQTDRYWINTLCEKHREEAR